MASCSISALMQGAGGFNAAASTPYQLAKLALLCSILKTMNPMATCDLPTLLSDAKCFCAVTNKPFEKVELQLLCEIRAAFSGAVSGVTGVDCGSADPVAPPVTGCTLYYRTDTGGLFGWDGGAWFPIVT